MNNDLLNKIQERIDTENIKPLPRWRFLLLRASFWLLAVLSVIIGSFAVGAILFLFLDYNQHNLLAMPYSATELLLMIPYLWIILFLLFIATARMSIAHTQKGYQYKIHTVIVVSVLLSIIFGSILNLIGISKIADESLDEVPLYNYITYDVRDAYSRPIIGRLAGIIVSVQDNENFSIQSFDGNIWKVQLASSTFGFIPKASSTIRMFGVLEASSSIFFAKSIGEWEQ
ncbi:MAG: hypothetical protein WCJ74_01235 [bacterium]